MGNNNCNSSNSNMEQIEKMSIINNDAFHFYVTFSNKIKWILLIDLFFFICSGGWIGIVLSIVYIIYGINKQSNIKIYLEELRKEYRHDKYEKK